MKKYTLNYQLAEGYVQHWLATSLTAETLDVKPTGGETEIEFRQRCLREHESDPLPFADHPQELDPFGKEFWGVVHCKADHLLEETATAPVWQRFVRWAYVQINLPETKSVNLELATSGAVTLWVNGNKVVHDDALQPLSQQGLVPLNISIQLKRGTVHLYLRLEEVALGDALLSASLRLTGPTSDKAITLLPVPNAETEARKSVEALYDLGYLSQPVVTFDDLVTVNFAKGSMEASQGILRIQDPSGGIRGETFCKQEPGASITSLGGYQMPAGPMQACLMPQLETFYNAKFQAQRIISFLNAPYHFASEPTGEYDDRLVVMVQEMTRQEGIFSEIAKMVLGWWEMVSNDEINKAVERVNRHSAGCLIDLLGLIGMVTRLERSKNFPVDLLPKIEAAITSFPYHVDKAFRPLPADETDRLLLATCQVLAGQKYSRAHFKVSGRTGAKERKQGETAVLALLKQSGQLGWREGYSRLDERIAALSHLADLASDETVGELAAILLDGTAFALAQYSYKGAFGAPQLQAVPSQLKSTRLAPSSSINYLLFGTGNYNARLLGAFSLAIAKTYEFPELIRSIAAEQPAGAWTIEHSARLDEKWETNQATYKTTDGMLSSLQDYQPGAWGGRVHPWQATLGPEAVVFSTHPASLDQTDGRQAGTWGGDGVLPRIAQWKDALICLYKLPEDDLLGYTHAYFPTFAFDEYHLENGWAYARKGDGYLAISASNMMELVALGDDANCELRVKGTQTAWVVQMGRRAQDGEFKDFCDAVRAHQVELDGADIKWKTMRGDQLGFAWSGPLLVNEQEQPLSFPKRFEGPFVDALFPAETMDVAYGEQLMRLSFS
jgi:hypothetical protein